MARQESQSRPELRGSGDSYEDLADVPATVVSIEPEADVEARSGVVQVVPWEAPGPLLVRLWKTAHGATTAPEAFFASLPPGDTTAALRFAVLAELLAVLGLLLTISLPLALLLLPGAPALLRDPTLRAMLLRAIALVVPGLSAAMVVLHALHGLGLDWAARREAGASPARDGRGLRFGLYSCGWDLLTLPFGLLIVLLLEGPRAMLRVLPLGLTVPGRAAETYLRSVHGLSGVSARRAARRAVALAAGAFLVGALVLGTVVFFPVVL